MARSWQGHAGYVLQQSQARVLGTEALGTANVVVVQLSPTPGTPLCEDLPTGATVDLLFDTTNWGLVRAVMFDSEGNSLTADIVSATKNPTFAPGTFAFTPPPGTTIITITGPVRRHHHYGYGCGTPGASGDEDMMGMGHGMYGWMAPHECMAPSGGPTAATGGQSAGPHGSRR